MTTQELWQSQTLDSPRITTAYLRGRADDSTRRVRQWNAVEYGTSVVGVILAILLAVSSTNFWTRAGAGLLVLSILVFAWGWRRVAVMERGARQRPKRPIRLLLRRRRCLPWLPTTSRSCRACR